MSVVSGRRLTGFLAGLRRRIRVLCQPRSENRPGLPIFFGEAGMSVVSGRRLTGFLAGLRRRIRVLCQPRSENCPGLPIFFGEGDLWFGLSSFRDVAFCELFSSLRDQFRISVMGEAVPSSAATF